MIYFSLKCYTYLYSKQQFNTISLFLGSQLLVKYPLDNCRYQNLPLQILDWIFQGDPLLQQPTVRYTLYILSLQELDIRNYTLNTQMNYDSILACCFCEKVSPKF